MDGWWNEEENFYPFEDSEDAPNVPEEPSNPFKPISVPDRFEQMDTSRTPPAPKAFVPPKPGQPYGQGFSRMPPLSPAKPFSQIQQGDLYGYSTPDDKPATVIPTNPYAVQPNPFGAGVGASPLGASTPDTLPTFTQRTGAVKRSDLHQTTSTGPVPIWSIDDDPIPATSAQGGANAPYPGFPPLPQTKPAPWQQPLMTAPVQDPNKDSLDWTLPDYPEANPDWQPTEDEAPVVPDFLKETPPEPVDETPEENASPMDKLNIPAYLRVQPLPKKKPRPQPEQEAAEEKPSVGVPVSAMDSEKGSEAQPENPPAEAADKEPAVYGDEIFMRPKDQTVAKEEASEAPADLPAEEATAPMEEQLSMLDLLGGAMPEPDDAPADTVETESAKPTELVSDTGDVPVDTPADVPNDQPAGIPADVAADSSANTPAIDTAAVLTPIPATEPSPEEEIISLTTAQTTDHEAAVPVAVTAGNRRSRRSRMAAREASAQDAANLVQPESPASPVSSEPEAPAEPQLPTDDPSPRKRRSRRAEQEHGTGDAASQEDVRPFVPTVGAEDPNTDSSAARPSLNGDVPAGQTASSAVSPLHAFVRRQPDAAFTPPADIDGEDDWQPFAKPFPADAPSFPEPPLFSAADSPFAHDLPPIPDAPEQEWSPFGAADKPDAPLFPEASPDSPFAHDLPPIPDAPEQEWSPFGTVDPRRSGTGSLYGDSFPSAQESPAAAGSLFGDTLPPVSSGALFPLIGDGDAHGSWDEPSGDERFSFLTEDGDLFKDGPSNLSSDESPLYGTSSFDAGDMPNPTRGNLPYELVSEFDTQNRQKEPLVENPPLFEPEPPLPEIAENITDSWTASNPATQQFTKPLLTHKAKQPKPPKPPINPVRLILLVLAIAMAVFCIVAGCKMLMGYVQNTEDWARTHEDFMNQHGVSMNQAGELVQLPQDGSTFAPAHVPAQAAVPDAMEGQHPVDDAQPTPIPVQRTRQYQYPDNPLRNQIESMTEIRKEYPEVIGRLVIPGVIDEWIMHRNNTYYLNHNYRGTSAEGGAVFMDAACTLDTPPENLHLRGSGSVPGKTFHALWQYKTGGSSFLYNAEVAHVTTLYEETQYLLYAVIETSGDPAQPDYFNYASHPTFATDEEMMNYLALARQHSLYTLPTDAQPGDRLLTLSTVTGADEAGGSGTNLVLIFRSMR